MAPAEPECRSPLSAPALARGWPQPGSGSGVSQLGRAQSQSEYYFQSAKCCATKTSAAARDRAVDSDRGLTDSSRLDRACVSVCLWCPDAALSQLPGECSDM